MNEQMKKRLEDVVTAIVNEKSNEAKQSFAQYLTMKTKSLLESDDDDKNERRKVMKVQDTIKMLQNTISQLQKLNQDSEVIGHVQSPINGYWSDLEDVIVKIRVEQNKETKEVYLNIVY